jgi:NAD(P)H-hydrate epimerase
MINGYSVEQIRAAEAPHLAAGEPLMRRAAAGLADEIRRALRETMHGQKGDDESTEGALPGDSGRVLLLVGSGDNGGDTLFAGAELAAQGVDVTILATGSRMRDDGLAAALHAGAHVENTDHLDAGRLAHLAARADVIIDGILGTGTSPNPALRGTARDIVAVIIPIVEAPDGPVVIAVDIPSGINPNDGAVPDPLVLPADVTVTFGGYKAGLLLPPASRLTGRVRLIDIGLGPDLAAFEPAVQVPE